jgi:hypothetical protein
MDVIRDDVPIPPKLVIAVVPRKTGLAPPKGLCGVMIAFAKDASSDGLCCIFIPN